MKCSLNRLILYDFILAKSLFFEPDSETSAQCRLMNKGEWDIYIQCTIMSIRVYLKIFYKMLPHVPHNKVSRYNQTYPFAYEMCRRNRCHVLHRLFLKQVKRITFFDLIFIIKLRDCWFVRTSLSVFFYILLLLFGTFNKLNKWKEPPFWQPKILNNFKSCCPIFI